MIVLDKQNYFIIIHQRAHALLSSKLLFNLKTEFKLETYNFFETLITTSAHDDGFAYSKGSYYITEEGFPKDFRKNEFEKEASMQILENAKLKSTWCYLLILSHMENLHADKEEEEIKNFLSYVQSEKNNVLKEQGILAKDLQNSYDMVKWADECSLQLCFHIKEPLKEQKIPGFQTIKSFSLTGYKSGYKLHPYPFSDRPLKLSLEYKKIPKRKFTSDSDLYNTLDAESIKKTIIKIYG